MIGTWSPCLVEGPTGGNHWQKQGRRLRVRSIQPDSRGAPGPRLADTTTRAQGALLNYRVNASVTRGRQARPEVCGARLHENAVVERRKARIPDRKEDPDTPRKRVGPSQAAPGVASPCVFRRSAPLVQEGEQRGRDFANPGRTPPRKRRTATAPVRGHNRRAERPPQQADKPFTFQAEILAHSGI